MSGVGAAHVSLPAFLPLALEVAPAADPRLVQSKSILPAMLRDLIPKAAATEPKHRENPSERGCLCREGWSRLALTV